MPPREPADRLEDILAAIERIVAHTAAIGAPSERDTGLADVYRDAVHYQLLVIGEAIGALPEEVRERDPEVPWRAIVGLRNRLAHEYFLIDPAQIRAVVDRDLGDLARRVAALADELRA